jgi:hypothetical protein
MLRQVKGAWAAQLLSKQFIRPGHFTSELSVKLFSVYHFRASQTVVSEHFRSCSQASTPCHCRLLTVSDHSKSFHVLSQVVIRFHLMLSRHLLHVMADLTQQRLARATGLGVIRVLGSSLRLKQSRAIMSDHCSVFQIVSNHFRSLHIISEKLRLLQSSISRSNCSV